jgi:hypothetical protein
MARGRRFSVTMKNVNKRPRPALIFVNMLTIRGGNLSRQRGQSHFC